jgi:hypothetical protein
MASVRSITFTLGIALAASSALAQTQTSAPALTAAQTDVACAPSPVLGVAPIDAPLVAGNQDTVTRSLVGDNFQLVINAGTDRGVQFNQRYFVRRIYRNADDIRSKEPHLVTTTGWLHITAVNKTMALAAVDHTCSHILEGDFLEPFHAPDVPDNIAFAETTGELNFKAYGRVLYGQSERWIAGPGDFMLIDRGADKNVSVGSHFAIYRDREVTGLPQTPIGEATAVSVGPTLSVVRITQARDAVSTRDVVVPRGPARAGGSGAAPGWQTSASDGPSATSETTPGPALPADMLARVASAIAELAEYGRLMADESTREAAGHLKAASNIVRRLPRPWQDIYQGTPSEFSVSPPVDSTLIAASGDVYALVNSAIRELTEYGSLMVDSVHQPANVPLDATPFREADERLKAATRTVDRLQHLPR